MNYFVFGDVHGDAKSLKNLIKKVRSISGEVEFFSVGDLLDRGPASKEVINICIQEGVQGILGNHELWMHRFLSLGEFDDFALHGMMGGKKTLLSYGLPEQSLEVGEIQKRLLDLVPESHRDFFLSLPLDRTLRSAGKTYRITHGGIPLPAGTQAESIIQTLPEAPQDLLSENILSLIKTQKPSIFLWGGAKKNAVYRFPDGSYQIFGHTPWKGGAEISDEGQFIALDTGCGTCPPYRLSGVLLSEEGDKKIVS